MRERVNERIRARKVRVVCKDANLGVMNISEALKLARGADLDLVEVAPKANPPVCKIVEYGKFKYEQSKNIQKPKHQKVKELKF